MLPDLLLQHLKEIEDSIKNLEDIYVERYEEEILTIDRINIRIRLRFPDGHLLELNEAVTIEEEQIRILGYRYHFQDEHNSLVFRYDNTPHFPDVPTFPHHKHLPDKVIAAEGFSIPEIIEEAGRIAS